VTVDPTTERLGINYIDTKDRPDLVRFAYPSRRNAEAASVYASFTINGVLRFRAECGRFSVTTESVQAFSEITTTPHIAGMLTILDENNHASGMVQAPPNLVASLGKEPRESSSSLGPR
jgi:hypothetical protein